LLQINSLSDIGIKRKDNQDNFWSAILHIDSISSGVICLCDGMGGLSEGNLASEIVVETIREGITTGVPFKDLGDYFAQANRTINNLGNQQNGLMGTTCTLLQCHDGKYEIWHVGDSRCYLQRGNTFEPLTVDHSAIRQYNLSKSSDAALFKKYKNSLTRCIGAKPDVLMDYYSGSYIEDDLFFVCSDGIWHYLSDNCVTRSTLLNLNDLIKKCIDYGETDNMTACYLLV